LVYYIAPAELRDNGIRHSNMFGNLFEEDEEEGSPSTSSRGTVAKGGDEPPPPRGRSNLCGIKNQGGTCYLNSLLQTLLFTPEFRGEAGGHRGTPVQDSLLTSGQLLRGQCVCRVRTVMENLEKSWNFKMVIPRPGTVMEKT